MSEINITPLPYCADSGDYFSKLQSLPYCCWLDSGKPDSNYGRYDIMTALPHYRLVTRGKLTQSILCEYDWQSVETPRELVEDITEHDPLKLIQNHIDLLSSVKHKDIPFIGGVIGYFAYDLGYRYHDIVNIQTLNTPATGSGLADMQAGIYHWALVQDHQHQQCWLAALPECDGELLNFVGDALKTGYSVPRAQFRTSALNSSLKQSEYLCRLARIHDYILAGDCYQVNFSQRFHSHYQGNPYSAYQILRKTMASPFSAYLQFGQQAVLSLSPERFLRVNQGKVLTQPIKGTCKRAEDIVTDQHNAVSLQKSEKNRAENLMIVDLLRNDLGRQCIPGSIKVKKLFELESFPNVHHLVSSIDGILCEGSTALDLLRDCFPGGSITGAPKKRAMEIICELEPVPRGIYCGSIGYINNNGDMDTNIAIRTVICDGETLYCSGGGGIVADSEASEEHQESLDKIQAILRVLGVCRI